jgi:hypothetical protein
MKDCTEAERAISTTKTIEEIIELEWTNGARRHSVFMILHPVTRPVQAWRVCHQFPQIDDGTVSASGTLKADAEYLSANTGNGTRGLRRRRERRISENVMIVHITKKPVLQKYTPTTKIVFNDMTWN